MTADKKLREAEKAWKPCPIRLVLENVEAGRPCTAAQVGAAKDSLLLIREHLDAARSAAPPEEATVDENGGPRAVLDDLLQERLGKFRPGGLKLVYAVEALSSKVEKLEAWLSESEEQADRIDDDIHARLAALEASAAKKGETMCVRCGKGPPPVGGNVHGQCEPASAPPPASAAPTAYLDGLTGEEAWAVNLSNELWGRARGGSLARRVDNGNWWAKRLLEERRSAERAARERAIEEIDRRCQGAGTIDVLWSVLAGMRRALLAPEKEAK